MDPRPPVAAPCGQGPLSCRTCGCELQDRKAFIEHHRTPWHLYNMRRRNQQLPVVSMLEFERKIELLRLARQYAEGEGPVGAFQQMTPEDQETHVARDPQGVCAPSGAAAEFHAAVRCNIKGTDHLKKQLQQQQKHPEDDGAGRAAAADARTTAARAAAAAWRAALQQYPERCNLFEQMPAFSSAAENLKYMRKAYGFFIPDEEYCVNTAGLLRCLWREQQQEPRCLFCCRRFRGVRAALQHMQQQRHFQLKWNEEQQDLLQRFYDYRKSYYELLERLSGPRTQRLQTHESFSEVGLNQEMPAGAAGDAEAAGRTDGAESDWEDCSSEEGDAATPDSEQQKLEAILEARVLHRSHAIYCRQRVRRLEPQLSEKCVLQDMAGASSQRDMASHKLSMGLRKRQKLLKHLGILRGELSPKQQRLLLLPQQRRLLWQREAEQQRKWQHERMKLGIKTNILQRTILRETKFFL